MANYSEIITVLSENKKINSILKLANKFTNTKKLPTSVNSTYAHTDSIHISYKTRHQLIIEAANNHKLLREIIDEDELELSNKAIFKDYFEFNYTPAHNRNEATITEGYPNLSRIITPSSKMEIFVEINPNTLLFQLKGMVKAINTQLSSRIEKKALYFNLRLEDGQLWLTPKNPRINAENHDKLNFTASIPASYHHDFKYYETNINPNYLLTALSAFKDYERISIEAMDNILRPIQLTKYHGNIPATISVIAPIESATNA